MLYEYAVVWATTTRPSSHLGLKDFENDLIFLILALMFAEKKLKQYVSFIRSQLVAPTNVYTYKLFPTNPDLCFFQDILLLKLEIGCQHSTRNVQQILKHS